MSEEEATPSERGSEPEERKQWHPLLVDCLRYLLSDLLRIDPEHAVSALPTRIDVLIVSPVDRSRLPFPYHLLASRTIVELETPGEWPNWKSLHKLYADGVLYSLDQGIENMGEIGLWLIASRMSARFRQIARQELGGLEELSPGLWSGSFLGSPVLLIHLHELPITAATLPLHMVYSGPREREIMEFVLEHASEYPFFLWEAMRFHAHTMGEVMTMRSTIPPTTGILTDPENIAALVRILTPLVKYLDTTTFIDALGEERIIETIGEDKIIERLGEDKIIERLGEEKFIETIGEDRLRELLEKRARDREQQP